MLVYEAAILIGLQTESLFHTYSQYASMAQIPTKPSDEEQRTEAQLQDILERVAPSSPRPSAVRD